VREATFDLQARRRDQALDQEALDRLADALGDDRRRAEWRCAVPTGRCAWPTGRRRSARRGNGLACATRAGDDGLRLRALRGLAVAQILQGDVAGGRAVALQGLDEARRLGLRVVEAGTLTTLSVAASVQGDYVSQLGPEPAIPAALPRDRRPRERGRLPVQQGGSWLGWVTWRRRGAELDAVLPLLRANGDRVIEGMALGHLSALALMLGDETRALALARQALDIAQAAQARDNEVIGALLLGDAEAALGRHAEARQAYAQALALAREMDIAWQHDAAAGLARVALADGDITAARAALRPLLNHAAVGSTLDGTCEPRRIELTCHQVLVGAGDPRADDWLQRAHQALMARADAIGRSGGDAERGISGAALRQGFLQNIPHHREIVAAWVRQQAAGDVRNPSPDRPPCP